jgi:hypothetical protein
MKQFLGKNQNASTRQVDRHSHICIRLQVRLHDKWTLVEALGWNEAGFNFFHAEDLQDNALLLKRGFNQFSGTIVWRSSHASDEVIGATLVNELLFLRAKQVVGDAALRARLLKLIRVAGMVPQKRKVLASLGLDVSDAKLNDMVAQRRLERPMCQYGVKVASEVWNSAIQKALNLSTVVMQLEEWSQALAKPDPAL